MGKGGRAEGPGYFEHCEMQKFGLVLGCGGRKKKKEWRTRSPLSSRSQ